MTDEPASVAQLKFLWSLQKRLDLDARWRDDLNKDQARELIQQYLDRAEYLERHKPSSAEVTHG